MDDQKKLLETIMAEFDEELREHEKFKEEYGKRYEGLSEEERVQKRVEELELVETFLKKTGMKTEYIDIKTDKKVNKNEK